MSTIEHADEGQHGSTDTSQLAIHGYDGVELWVGNARQAAHYYRTALGFSLTAYAGPETGVTDRCSYVLDQGEIRLVLTGALDPEHPIAHHHHRHGDGIRDLALRVDDAHRAYSTVVARGASPVHEPTVLEDEHGQLVVAAVAVYGDTIHSLVQRDGYAGVHRPGYVPVDAPPPQEDAGLRRIDHAVANVAEGEMERWTRFYARVLGFHERHHFDAETISTGASALMSKVLADESDRIKLPINEPARASHRSQIDEYLEAYQGPGVQHLALETHDIVTTVAILRERGVSFLPVPREYYLDARSRVGELEESWDDLERLGVLVDRDDEGYLLQIFTEPVQDRPTLFFELIQRQGARGFGAGNFKALFEAIERAQARRGNL
ncbi:MAG: 4-hydroxyphenylpyruvate dioxygenase [Actinomycetota bacterium]